MSDNQTKVIVGTAVAVGTLTAGLAYLYAKNATEPIPIKWKKVGQLVDLNYFPVKSCAPIKGSSFNCHVLGIESDSLFDRCFVISQNNKQVTARTYPKMLLIQPKIDGNKFILSAPGKSNLVLDLEKLKQSRANEKVQLWSCKVAGVDAGDEAAEWFSTFLVGKNSVFRLIYYPYSYATKVKPDSDKKYKAYKGEDTGSYHDATSYMLINQASIDELNSHLDHVVKPLQLRPNLVIKGPQAYEEDNWKWIRIGDNVVFRGLKPCQRCIFSNINPETAERNPHREPLETLIKTRSLIPNESPVMGLHLGIRIPGKISIGDDVCINDEN